MSNLEKSIQTHINRLLLKLVALRINSLKEISGTLKKKDGKKHDHNHRHTG